MEKAPPSTLVKWTVFVGINLLGIFCNIPWVWGNLSVYCSSYFHSRVDPASGQIAPWLVSLNTMGLAIGVLVCGKLRQMVGLRASLIIGIVLFNGGVFSAYFAVRYSSVLLDFTLGLFPGIGMGIVQGCQYTLVVRWTDRYQALAAASVESTCVFGSVPMNAIVTLYANPNNLVPDEKVGRLNLFSQPEVLDRVESTFLVYGLLSLVLNCLGFLVTRDFPGDRCYLISLWYEVKGRCQSKSKSRRDNNATEKSYLKSSAESCIVAYSDVTAKDVGIDDQDGSKDKGFAKHKPKDVAVFQKHESSKNGGVFEKRESKDTNKNRVKDESQKTKDTLVECGTVDKNEADVGTVPELSPRQVLKTRVFYTLWLTMGIADFTFIVVTTYFKAFGLLYIHDDHFLTSIGTVMCVAIALASYGGGFVVDKWGVKHALVGFVSLLCLFSNIYYITPSVNKWLYMVFCCGFGAFDFALICMLSCVALKLWGEAHLSTNYGMLLSSCFITNTVLPPVIEVVILKYGWFTLFTSVSVSILGALILCVWQVPASKP